MPKLGNPGREGGLESRQVQEVEQVAERPLGGRGPKEAQCLAERGRLMACALSDGGRGVLAAPQGGAGEQGEEGEVVAAVVLALTRPKGKTLGLGSPRGFTTHFGVLTTIADSCGSASQAWG